MTKVRKAVIPDWTWNSFSYLLLKPWPKKCAIVDKPTIQIHRWEAQGWHRGYSRCYCKSKRSIEDHFDSNFRLSTTSRKEEWSVETGRWNYRDAPPFIRQKNIRTALEMLSFQAKALRWEWSLSSWCWVMTSWISQMIQWLRSPDRWWMTTMRHMLQPLLSWKFPMRKKFLLSHCSSRRRHQQDSVALTHMKACTWRGAEWRALSVLPLADSRNHRFWKAKWTLEMRKSSNGCHWYLEQDPACCRKF